jgi:hypothetical protein
MGTWIIFTHETESPLLFGGKGGAGPSLLHITLEGPTEYLGEITVQKS